MTAGSRRWRHIPIMRGAAVRSTVKTELNFMALIKCNVSVVLATVRVSATTHLTSPSSPREQSYLGPVHGNFEAVRPTVRYALLLEEAYETAEP